MNYWQMPPDQYLKDMALKATREILHGTKMEDFML
jgi:hypothetical protein